jgi:IK cytokine
VLEGSDEDEDVSKMDMGAKGEKRLQRYDFETQEEYDRYHLEREAMPKAAFQFGVKTADGRKTRKTQNKEQKLNNELHRIEKMISAKKDARSKGEEGAEFVRYGGDEEAPGKKQRTEY